MDDANPYGIAETSPKGDSQEETSSPPPPKNLADALVRTPWDRSLEELQGTRPWVQFLGITTGIGSAVMLLIALVLMGASKDIFLPLVYGALGMLFLYPTAKLNRYGNRIKDLLESRSTMDLERALLEQRLAWRFYGILTIIYLVVAILLLLGLVGGSMRGK